jgi:FtsZ-binding cell division protein ZapB
LTFEDLKIVQDQELYNQVVNQQNSLDREVSQAVNQQNMLSIAAAANNNQANAPNARANALLGQFER